MEIIVLKIISIDQANISKIILAVEECVNWREVWFRGQANSQHSLEPTLFRKGTAYFESEMLEEFVRSQSEYAIKHKSALEWLTLMQHYGLPTRLLDWTSNLLVALYFSCKAEEELDSHGALFLINPDHLMPHSLASDLIDMLIRAKWEYETLREIKKSEFISSQPIVDDTYNWNLLINGMSLNKFIASRNDAVHLGLTKVVDDSNFDIAQIAYAAFLKGSEDVYPCAIPLSDYLCDPRAYRSPYLNERISRQHGFFTVHGGKYIGSRRFIVPRSLEDVLGDKCVKLIIAPADKLKILRELEMSGISEHTLFPELEYQAKFIKQKFAVT